MLAASHNVTEQTKAVADATQNAKEMTKYFGPLHNRDIDTFASDAFAHETHNLPRAYIGRNKFLMATIDFLITKDDDWYTRHVLPWLYTEELHVKWNIWRFNRTMMDYEPEQGVPRYVSYESESRSDSLVRRGLAFIIEHGFYKTEIGRQHYLMNLKQIVEAVHETVYFGVMHELLASPNYYRTWLQKHGNRPSIMSNDATALMAEERWRFACVQKDVKGLFVLDAEIKDRMRRVGIEPDSWIFPSKMAIYASMVPEYFNEYNRGGAPATTALEDGSKRFDTFRGNRVFETRSFDTDFMAEGSIEPLVRTRQIGEYYVHGDGDHDRSKGMQIFDMSRDRFVTITHNQAHNAALEYLENQTEEQQKVYYENLVKDYFKNATDGKTTFMKIYNSEFALNASREKYNEAKSKPTVENAREKIPEITEAAFQFIKGLDSEVKTIKKVFTSLTGDDFGWAENEIRQQEVIDALSDKDLRKIVLSHLPVKILLFRPRMTYNMATAVLLKGGEELGNTLHGHHDFQLTDDVIHKTHIGHYTFYSKSVVREPKNMYLAEDVYCTGYEGGENTKFVEKTDQLQEAMTHATPSIVAHMVPYSSVANLHTCISVTGSMSHHELNVHDREDSDFVGPAIDKEFVHGGESKTVDLEEDDMRINGLCFRGSERHYNLVSGQYDMVHHNTGHWGPNVYDGCGSVRLGMYAHLKQVTT